MGIRNVGAGTETDGGREGGESSNHDQETDGGRPG